MRKYIAILLCILLFILITGCQSGVVTITIDLPYIISFDVGAEIGQLDFKVPIKDVRVIYSLSSSLHTSFDGSILNYSFAPDTADGDPLIKVIPYEISQYPLVIHRNTIEVDIAKRDINKFNTDFIGGYVEFYNSQNQSGDYLYYDEKTKHLNFSYASVRVQDIYTGYVDIITIQNGGDIKSLIDILSPAIKKLEEAWCDDFIESHPHFVEFVSSLTEGLLTDEEKLKAIVSWAHSIEPYTPEGTIDDLTYCQQFGVDNTIKTGRGNCTNTAYFIKACLDQCGIENRLVQGYIPAEKQFHIMNAIKGDKGFEFTPEVLELIQFQNQHINIKEAALANKKWLDSEWMWLDGTLNQINDMGLYFCFRAFQDMDLDSIK